MRTRSVARRAVQVAATSIVAGCSPGSNANGADNSTAPQLQLRLVTSSAEEPCSAPPLTSNDPGSTCDRAGTTTYELAKSLGRRVLTATLNDDVGVALDDDVIWGISGARPPLRDHRDGVIVRVSLQSVRGAWAPATAGEIPRMGRFGRQSALGVA